MRAGRRRTVAAGLAVLVGAAVWLSFRGAGGRPAGDGGAGGGLAKETDAEPGTRSRPTLAAGGPAGSSAAGDGAEAPSKSPPPTPPGPLRHATLDVEVVDAGERPVAGATVRVYGTFEWDSYPPAPSVRAEGVTGADGRVSLSPPVSPREMAWPGALFVHAWKEQAAAVSDALDPWAPDPADVGRATVRLRLALSPTIEGRVTADDGTPISGAVVEAGCPDTVLVGVTTAADGSFRFPPIPAERLGESVRVAARADALATAERSVPVLAARRLVADLVLDRLRVVTVRCVSPKGLEVPFRIPSLGRILIENEWPEPVRAGGQDLVVTPEPPFIPRRVRIGPKDASVVVPVEPGGRIRGNVVEEDGTLAHLFRYGTPVLCERPDGLPEAEARLGRDGAFAFDGIGPGEHVLRTEWTTHGRHVIEWAEARGVRAGDEDVRLVLRAAGLLRVIVRSAVDGDVVPVRAYRIEATGPAPATTVTVRSEPDRGRDRAQGENAFDIGLSLPGAYRVRVKVPGYAWTERDPVEVGAYGAASPLQEFRVTPERR